MFSPPEVTRALAHIVMNMIAHEHLKRTDTGVELELIIIETLHSTRTAGEYYLSVRYILSHLIAHLGHISLLLGKFSLDVDRS